MADRHMKRCSASLIIREIQIKTIMRYNFTPVRMTVIKKITNSKCWWGYGEKEILEHCWWEHSLVQPLWKTIWNFLKKLKVELPTISLLGIHPKKPPNLIKDTCTPGFTVALFTKLWYGSNPVSELLIVIQRLLRVKCRFYHLLTPTLNKLTYPSEAALPFMWGYESFPS